MNSADRIRKLIAENLDDEVNYRHRDIMANVPFDQIAQREGWDDAELSKKVSGALGYWVSGELNVNGYTLRNISDNGTRVYRMSRVKATPAAPDNRSMTVKVCKTLKGGKLLLEDVNGTLWVATKVEL